MRAYAIRRLVLIIPTMFILTLFLFVLIRLIPGDVVEMMVQEQVWEQEVGTERELNVEAIRHQLGLDAPPHIQYLRWVGNIFRGDFGKSLWTNDTLMDMMRLKLPVTIELSILSLVLGTVFSVPIGIYAAIRQDTILDYLMRSWSILAAAESIGS